MHLSLAVLVAVGCASGVSLPLRELVPGGMRFAGPHQNGAVETNTEILCSHDVWSRASCILLRCSARASPLSASLFERVSLLHLALRGGGPKKEGGGRGGARRGRGRGGGSKRAAPDDSGGMEREIPQRKDKRNKFAGRVEGGKGETSMEEELGDVAEKMERELVEENMNEDGKQEAPPLGVGYGEESYDAETPSVKKVVGSIDLKLKQSGKTEVSHSQPCPPACCV